MDTSNRPNHKRTFSESDSVSRTERYLCSFTHLWIINYLSSYIDDPNFICLQSETFSPATSPYSNTRWSLKLYPRGLNEKQHSNQNIAIFLKYVSGTIPTIKAKAEFSVVSRNNDLVMLRSTNFHTFSSGNDWGYSEFLDSNYLNTRRNDLLTDDCLRVYVRVILVDEKEILLATQQQQQQQPSTSSSSINSSASYRLFSNEKERIKSLELFSNQIQSLFDDQRFTDVHIHVIPKQENQIDHQPKLALRTRRRSSIRQQYRNLDAINEQQSLSNESYSMRRTTRSNTFRFAAQSSSSSLDQENHLSHLTPLATYHVHRSILVARSSVFANQIRSKSSPINVYIDDLQPFTVRTMLIYIYTGHLPVINEELMNNFNLIDLFRASVKYNLHELRDLTKKTMLDNLKIDNAIEILEISDQVNDHDLKQQILSFVRANASAIAKTSNWLDCTKQNPQLIIDAFRSLVTPNTDKYSNHFHQTVSLTTTAAAAATTKHSN